MGTQTIVFGYIETDRDSEDYNKKALSEFSYDDVYPLRKVFSQPVEGYRGATISFSDSIKATSNEWFEWLDRFELLLVSLKAISAKLYFEDTESAARKSFSYIYSDGEWIKWELNVTETETSESILQSTPH